LALASAFSRNAKSAADARTETTKSGGLALASALWKSACRMCAAIAAHKLGHQGRVRLEAPFDWSRIEKGAEGAPSTPRERGSKKGAVRAMSGEANASAVHPNHRRSTANAAPPSAAWNPEPPMVL